MANLLHGELTEKIIGAFYQVYNELGYGFLEKVYEQALLILFAEDELLATSQNNIKLNYHGREIATYISDIIVDGKVIVEIKAARILDESHEAQLINYLKATGIEVGLLLNFGPKPTFKRFVFEKNKVLKSAQPVPSAAQIKDV